MRLKEYFTKNMVLILVLLLILTYLYQTRAGKYQAAAINQSMGLAILDTTNGNIRYVFAGPDRLLSFQYDYKLDKVTPENK